MEVDKILGYVVVESLPDFHDGEVFYSLAEAQHYLASYKEKAHYYRVAKLVEVDEIKY